MRRLLGTLLVGIVFAGCGAGTKTVIEKTVTERAPAHESRAERLRRQFGIPSDEETERELGLGEPVGSGKYSQPPTGKYSGAQPIVFRSPTGNILCTLESSAVYCQIKDMAWTPPPRPPDCNLDWGHGVAVYGTNAAGFYCYGGVAAEASSPPLPYGDILRRRPFVCVSLAKGMTCGNKETRHAFFLSYEKAWTH